MIPNPIHRNLRSLVIAGIAAVAASCPAAVPAPPPYAFVRSQEDWSVLRTLPSRGQDPFDIAKYIPLDADSPVWATIGGDFRARVESWRSFNFDAPRGVSHDDTFLLTRARASTDVHVDRSFRIFGEVKTAEASGRNLPGGVRPVDQDKFELQQLFADLRFDLGSGASLVLRPGRQEYAFGVQRLVSPLPWANSLRTWDGLSAILDAAGWNVTAFDAAFVPVVSNGVGRANHNEQLGGVYARHLIAGPKSGVELYALHNDWAAPHTFNGTQGADRRWTWGLRRWGSFTPGTDYEVEADYQTGRTGPGNVAAWSFASEAGYRLSSASGVRLWVGLDWASGDRKSGGDVQTFNQLYPLGHAYFGAIDTIGRQNIIDLSAGATWTPMRFLALKFGAHDFRADSTHDAIYNAGGGVVRAGGTYRSAEIGTEADLVVTWKASRHLVVEAGYGHFFAGDAMRESGPSADIDFGYGSLTFTF